MKRLLIFSLVLALLTACGESNAPFTDNGSPGEIKAIFFYDGNKNGNMDEGEKGVTAQEIVGISQEVSCPPAGTPSYVDTDASGAHEFKDLQPGKYCLYLNNGFLPTTKQTQEVYVSSDQVTTVYFGIAE